MLAAPPVAAPLLAAASNSANDITPGVLGFLVIAAMGAALFLLLRSMNKHLRRVRAVRDAGLAPGSDLGSVAVGGALRGSAESRADISADGSVNGRIDGRIDGRATTDQADGTGGAAGR